MELLGFSVSLSASQSSGLSPACLSKTSGLWIVPPCSHQSFLTIPQLFRVILWIGWQWVIKPCQVRGGFIPLSDPRLVSPAQSPYSQGWGSSARPSNLPRLSCLLVRDHRRGASPKLKLHSVPFLRLISRTPTAWPCDTQSFCENWEGYWQFGSCCSCLCMQRT